MRTSNRQQQQQQLTGVTWTARLTIILVGTSILFSLFFGIEFLINKISSFVAAEQTGAFLPNKFGFNFDLIYEDELQVLEDEAFFRHPLGAYRIRADLKLRRLLDAHHIAMPFNPDTWSLAEPARQLHLLSGNMSLCLRDLRVLGDRVASAIAAGDTFGPLAESGAEQLKLMQLLDSFGRPEAGTLVGHPFWLGSYLGCQQVGAGSPRLKIDGRPLETRYCVGKVRLNSWASGGERDLGHALIKLGLCLPRSCDSLALMEVADGSRDAREKSEQVLELVRSLAMHNFNQRVYPSAQLNLTDIFCLPADEKRALSFAGIAFVTLLCGWLAFVILCTWLRQRRRNSETTNSMQFLSNQILESVAVDANIELLLRPTKRRDPNAINLDALDCIKHLGCVGVILAHVLLTYLTLGTGYSHTVDSIGKDLRTMLLLSLNNVVDTFFVISGLLVSYLTLSKLEAQQSGGSAAAAPRVKRSNYLGAYLGLIGGRYLRIAPLYFLVYAFAKTVAAHLGSGPLWDYATSSGSIRGLCQREHWLWPVAFASDFKPIIHHCVPPAWSLAVDFHFFLVLPPLIVLLRSSRRLGYSLLAALIVASTALSLADYRSLLDYVSPADFARLRLHVFTILIRYAAHAYSRPQNRVGPILVGLVGGHLLFEFEQRRRRRPPAPARGQRRSGAGRDSSDETRAGAGASSRRADSSELCGERIQSSGEWPRFMRGNWFRATLASSAMLMLAPLIVQLRDRARGHLTALGLETSAALDCQLALVGFVLIKPLWSACNCVLFLRLLTEPHARKWPARLMTLPLWSALSKFNYALLLVHFELIAYDAMSQLQLQPVTWPSLLCKFAFAYWGSLLVAAPLYLLFELPARRLIKWRLKL